MPGENIRASCPFQKSSFEALVRAARWLAAGGFEGVAMRKIVAGLFVTLDGVIEEPNDWMGPYFSPEIGQAVGSLMAAQDAMLLGRVTYEGFAAYWPQQSGEMADTMNGTPKYVVSGALASAS